MKRKLGDFSGKLGDSLQIPKDLSYKEAVLTLTGSRELYIENYKCIRQYQDTCIILLSKREKSPYSLLHRCGNENKRKYQ